MEYLTLGELLNELDCHDDEEILNVELTGEWGRQPQPLPWCWSPS